MSIGQGGTGKLVEAKSLAFRYRRGGALVVDDLHFAFSTNSLTAVVGPSGCGKSTLLYLLGLLVRPTGGRVLWRGSDVSTQPDHVRSNLRAAAIGFIFQDALLDPSRSILANVLEAGLYAGLEPSRSRARALELLDQFGVEGRSHDRPGELSGGQAQRVALCRALVKSPELILADEPSGNLDEASAEVVWSALRDAASQGAAVVVATHDSRRARTADRMLAL